MTEKKTSEKKGKKPEKNDKFQCSSCGLVITVDEPCNCVEACDLICCDKPMKPKGK